MVMGWRCDICFQPARRRSISAGKMTFNHPQQQQRYPGSSTHTPRNNGKTTTNCVYSGEHVTISAIHDSSHVVCTVCTSEVRFRRIGKKSSTCVYTNKSDNEQKVSAGVHVRFVLRTTPHHFSFPVPSLHLSLYL